MPKKQYEYQHTIQEYVGFVTKKKQLQNHGTGDTQTTQRRKTKAEIFEEVVSYTAIIITIFFVIIPMLLVAAAVISTAY